MKLIETTNAPVDLFVGVVFFMLGGYMLFFRKKVIDALLASNKVFWGQIGLGYNEKIAINMTNLVIPIMGFLFFCVGILLTYRAIIFLFK